ncbi:hypothetical protein T484DRAFT_1914459, partial [Baffinella frigidus]
MRLPGVFMTIRCNPNGSIPLHEFSLMSQKLVKEGVDASAPRRLLLLYSALSVRTGTINAQAFRRLAAEFSLAEFRPGPLRGEARLSAEQEELMDNLEPLAKAANDIMAATFRREEDVTCRDLAARWDMMKDLIVKRKRPELAWAVFNATTKGYSLLIKKEAKEGDDLFLSSSGGGLDGASAPPQKNLVPTRPLPHRLNGRARAPPSSSPSSRSLSPALRAGTVRRMTTATSIMQISTVAGKIRSPTMRRLSRESSPT